MLFCDSCDLGYHMLCHAPRVRQKPHGRWECSTCSLVTGYVNDTCLYDQKTQDQLIEELFTPVLPPQPAGAVAGFPGRGPSVPFRTSPDAVPADWLDVPVVDSTVPDCSGWSPAKVSHYLVQHGIKEDYAKVFFDEASSFRPL